MEISYRPIKRCRVCTDRAIGFNFNGLSCGSCKSFFRRNITKYDSFTCKVAPHACAITLANRKFCTKCRLDKCLAIGMRQELITFRDKVSPSRTRENLSQSQSLETSGNLLKISGNLSENLPPLTAHEGRHLSLIISAASVFGDEESAPLAANSTELLWALNLSEDYIRKSVVFCKRLPAFRGLQGEDQLIQLKGFLTEFLILRCAFTYRSEVDGFTVIQDEHGEQHTVFLFFDSIMLQANKSHLAEPCRSFFSKFGQLLEQDKTVRNLIIVIQLFKLRTSPKLCYPEAIHYQYTLYRRLLKRYLEEKYRRAPGIASAKYGALMRLLAEIAQIRSILEQLFIGADAAKLAALLCEVFRE